MKILATYYDSTDETNYGTFDISALPPIGSTTFIYEHKESRKFIGHFKVVDIHHSITEFYKKETNYKIGDTSDSFEIHVIKID